MNKSRISYFDTAKGILIILVIIGHCIQKSGLESSTTLAFYPAVITLRIICSFHMPAFFILSGILFNTDKWCAISITNFIKKRSYQLLVPYFFFEVCGYIWYKTLYGDAFPNIGRAFLNTLLIQCNVGACWFLPTLFISEIILYICCKYGNKIVNSLIAVVSLFSFVIAPNNVYVIAICRCLVGYTFLFIGFSFKKNLKLLLEKRRFILVSAIILLGINLIQHKTELYSGIIGNPILYVIGALAGTIFILHISKLLDCAILQYIGQNTLQILGTHQLPLHTLVWYCTYLSPEILFISGFFSIVVFESVIVPLYTKFIPFLIGKPINNTHH